MFIRGVIDYKINKHADAALPASPRELDEVAQRPVARIDVVVVCDIVSVIAAGRRLKRHQPDGCDSHALEIIQTPHEAFEVADPVAVCIHISCNGKAIDNRIFVPEIVDHGCNLSSAIELEELIV